MEKKKKVSIFLPLHINKGQKYYSPIDVSTPPKFHRSKKVVHWGVSLSIPIPHDTRFADYHLTDLLSASQLNKKHGSSIAAGITSKDFICYPDFIPGKKQWDVITVSHNSRRKCLPDILQVLRNALNANPNLTALIVVNTPTRSFRHNNSFSEVNFISQYKSIFNYKERRQIVLLRISDELGLEGVSPTFIYWLLSNSRSFLFASRKRDLLKLLLKPLNMD